jgi:hypothetical protein
VPAKPSTGPLQSEPALPPTPPADDTNPTEALARLREKSKTAAEEFAQGKINRAQFHAIYNRYSEQRRIIEELLARDPGSTAWQHAARPGHTTFLRQHFTARVLFFALFPIGQTRAIVHHGKQTPRAKDMLPVLRALPDLLKERGTLAPARKPVDGGHWLVIVPGRYTVSMVLYSLEPAREQIHKVADLHSDFEQANIHALQRGEFRPRRLVFPQRALFE